jgi:hypothetical protein
MKMIRRSLLLSLVGAFACATAVFAADFEEGFKPLFNGKDLKGWDGEPKIWSMKDGVVVGDTSNVTLKTNTFLVWRDGTVDDFVLRFKYRIKNGNSGVQYRSKEMTNVGTWVVGGYQADFEAGKTYSGILYEERGKRGIMALRGEKVVWDENGKKNIVEKFAESDALQAKIKHEDWNDYEVTAQGFHFVHKINGNVTVDVTDNDEKNRVASGILALQVHVGPAMTVEFKDVMLKRLPLNSKKN